MERSHETSFNFKLNYLKINDQPGLSEKLMIHTLYL
jgi:hypothetical protein